MEDLQVSWLLQMEKETACLPSECLAVCWLGFPFGG